MPKKTCQLESCPLFPSSRRGGKKSSDRSARGPVLDSIARLTYTRYAYVYSNSNLCVCVYVLVDVAMDGLNCFAIF